VGLLILSNGLVIFLLERSAWKPAQIRFNEFLKYGIEYWLITLKVNLFSGKTGKEQQQSFLFNAVFCSLMKRKL